MLASRWPVDAIAVVMVVIFGALGGAAWISRLPVACLLLSDGHVSLAIFSGTANISHLTLISHLALPLLLGLLMGHVTDSTCVIFAQVNAVYAISMCGRWMAVKM